VSVGILLVVSTGVVVTVSDDVLGDDIVEVESELMVEVSLPVVDSGVSHPTAAIARNAMKSMLFIRMLLSE